MPRFLFLCRLENIYLVFIKDIQIGSNNVRLTHATKELDELAASIKEHGLLQPVILAGEFGKPPYQLISGQRRFLAHQKILNTKEIKAVFAGKLTDTEAIIRSLVENMQRLDLEYEDTAKAITYLYQKFGKDDRKVQRETGLSLRKIREYIFIDAQATPKMRRLLKNGAVSPVDVKRALRAAQGNITKAEDLLDYMVESNPNSHQKKRIVQYGEENKDMSPSRIVSEAMKPHVEDNIIISLPEEVKVALKLAMKELSMDPEELASKAISDWLRSKGFLK